MTEATSSHPAERPRTLHIAALGLAAMLALGACAPAEQAEPMEAAASEDVNAEVEAAYGPESMPPGAASPDQGPAEDDAELAPADDAPADDDPYQAALDAYDAGAKPDVPDAPPSDFGDDFTEIMWDDLYGLDLDTGEPTDLLSSVDGQPVAIPGFMVPLEDFKKEVSEFLFVPYAQACIHVPAPPANQIVHVTMLDGSKAPYSAWDPVWIYGVLHIDDVEHMYGSASYTMDGFEVQPYQFGSS